MIYYKKTIGKFRSDDYGFTSLIFRRNRRMRKEEEKQRRRRKRTENDHIVYTRSF
jgi:hypothetical protein